VEGTIEDMAKFAEFVAKREEAKKLKT